MLDVSTVTITAEPGIDIAAVRSFKPFVEWAASLDERFVVKSIHVQSADSWGGAMRFLKFKAEVTDKAGRVIPGIVFMRGGSVGILPVFNCNGKRKTVLTVQPRIASGRFDFLEIPAGMLDGNGNFGGVAAKELKEELEITISEDSLIDLSGLAEHSTGYFVSPGGTDETMRLFAFEKDITEEELAAMEGKCTGLLDEGETITLKVVDLDESLLRIADGKTIIAYALYVSFCQKTA